MVEPHVHHCYLIIPIITRVGSSMNFQRDEEFTLGFYKPVTEDEQFPRRYVTIGYWTLGTEVVMDI